MFGNFTAQAGVISSSDSTSPNIISPKLNWNFNDVIVLDFNPPGVENINDRPRINVWRTVDGVPDLNFLIYISGGRKILSPAPTGIFIEPWGDRRTGSYTFPTTSISSGQSIIAGVDLFTTPYALPNVGTLSPPLDKWTLDTTSVDGEFKYQYQFEFGNNNPFINIELQNKPICGTINPFCPEDKLVVYLGLNQFNCPMFECIEPFNFIEKGDLYNNNTWVNNVGLGNFGKWQFFSGVGTRRAIINSNQNGRESIGEKSFFIIGATGQTVVAHSGIFFLNNGLKSGESLSLDSSVSWFDGSRVISFYTGIGTSNPICTIDHNETHGDAIRFRYTMSTGTFTGIITTNGFNKALNHKIINRGSGLLFETTYQNNQIFNQFIDIPSTITGLGFITRLSKNVLPQDVDNYGLCFNNIQLSKYVDISRINWGRYVACELVSTASHYYKAPLQINTRVFEDPDLSIPIPNGTYGSTIFPTVIGPVTFRTYTTNNGVIISTGSCTIILS